MAKKKKKAVKKKVKKKAVKKKVKKKAKGLASVLVSFKKVEDMTLGQVYGTRPIPITRIAANIWQVIKRRKLRV